MASDTASRLVADPRWKWGLADGMTFIPVGFERERWLICWSDYDGEAGGYQTSGGKWWGIAGSSDPMNLADGSWLPDLSDPATTGVLLSWLPGGWGCGYDPRVAAERRWTVEVWCSQHGGQDLVAYGPILGEAVALALLALPPETPWGVKRG